MNGESCTINSVIKTTFLLKRQILWFFSILFYPSLSSLVQSSLFLSIPKSCSICHFYPQRGMKIKLTVTYLGMIGGIPGLNNHSFQSTSFSLLLFGKYSYKNFLKSSVSIAVYLNLLMYAFRNGSNASGKN